MSVVVPIEHDPHVAALALLPWYVRGQLGDEEMHTVQAHLQQCPTCHAECEAERAMQALLGLSTQAPAATDIETGLARLRERLQAEPDDTARRTTQARHPRWLGWILGLQSSAIVLLLALLIPARFEAPVYRGQTDPGARAAAEALIMFKPDASAQRIREVLLAHRASIVGGPTDSGAYLLQLNGGSQALSALRAEPVVALVESLEPGAGR